MEVQANNFAGYFLVPRDILQEEFDKLKIAKTQILVEAGIESIDDSNLIDYMVDDLAEVFNVSGHAMQICLDIRDK